MSSSRSHSSTWVIPVGAMKAQRRPKCSERRHTAEGNAHLECGDSSPLSSLVSESKAATSRRTPRTGREKLDSFVNFLSGKRSLVPGRGVAVPAVAPAHGVEPSMTLEPRRSDAVRAAASIPDEARLVIGQLRVDVVAAPPAQAREVVHVVTRTVSANGGLGTGGSNSKLRFGLGQM